MNKREQLSRAVIKCLRDLAKYDFGDEPVVYAHPRLTRKANRCINAIPLLDEEEDRWRKIMGCELTPNPNLPEDVVMVVDVENVLVSTEAIAFRQIKEND